MRHLLTVALLLSASLGMARPCAAATSFTYQGELKSGAVLAEGLFNMNFSLWSALSGGSQVGSAVNLANVAVTAGRFTVKLDFGANAFDNNNRWLQIAINGTTLSPRQEITRAPYSIQTCGIFVNDDGAIGIGTTTPAADLHVRGDGDGAVVRLTNGPSSPGQSSTALVIGDAFGEARAATVYGITSETLVDVRNDGTGPAAVFNGFVGVGRDEPLGTTEVFGLYKNTTGGAGMYIETATSGDPYYGYSAGGEDDASTWYEGPTNIWRLTMNGINRIGVNGNSGAVNVNGSLDVNGEVAMGPDNIRPPLAYGKVNVDGAIISASSNVSSVVHYGTGRYRVFLSTALTDTDLVVATSSYRLFVQAIVNKDSNGGIDFLR